MPEREGRDQNITPTPDRGSGRFSYKRALVCLVGANLGGLLFEQATKLSVSDFMAPRYASALGLAGWTIGAVLCGLVIPTEINRRIDHLGFIDAYKRMLS